MFFGYRWGRNSRRTLKGIGSQSSKQIRVPDIGFPEDIRRLGLARAEQCIASPQRI